MYLYIFFYPRVIFISNTRAMSKITFSASLFFFFNFNVKIECEFCDLKLNDK